MSLKLDFSVVQQTNCTEVLLTDTTGAYDILTNPGGWGGLNPSMGDVTTAFISVTTPSGVIYIIDVFTEVTNGTPITLTSVQLGGIAGTCIPDGQYYFSWSIITSSGDPPKLDVNTLEQHFFFDCVVACKVAGMFANLDLSNCNPCDETLTSKISKALLAWAYLEALRNSACCAKVANFTNLLSSLERMVDCSRCVSCG